ncbi:11287_t:CDS:2 [Paraglomus occultum]|uniref:11287_t:CDS:1 n=1 Tax=Paraglomus occultum TaxID=144539 RepID=A0A9N9AJH7_9GLOM|nr:11287_t:CDS:2 [Paraglomus occultum]
MSHSHLDPPRGVFTLPTPCDLNNAFWEPVKTNDHFVLQRTKGSKNAILRGVLGTIQNVFDTKQPPFRLLFRSDVNGLALQIAVSQTEKGIDDAWSWATDNLQAGLGKLDDPSERENYVVTKINSLVTRQDRGTDEVSEDESVRSASRAFRQTFDVSPTERLVNFYSCAYYRSITNQGWMYISENYLCFYSFLLGIETKLLIELKDIRDLVKEKSKRGMISDSIKVITKDGQEYFFSNLFHRDETYDLLVQLTSLSVQRLLKNATPESTPGMSLSDNNLEQSAESNNNDKNKKDLRISISKDNKEEDVPRSPMIPPLIKGLEVQKRDSEFQAMFALPTSEHLLEESNAMFSMPEKKESHSGKVRLSETYLTFMSNG